MMETGKNVLTLSMLILISMFIAQSVMAENFPTDESFIIGTWTVNDCSRDCGGDFEQNSRAYTYHFYSDYTYQYPGSFVGFGPFYGTWSYNSSTGIIEWVNQTGQFTYTGTANSGIEMSGRNESTVGDWGTWSAIKTECSGDFNGDGGVDNQDLQSILDSGADECTIVEWIECWKQAVPCE